MAMTELHLYASTEYYPGVDGVDQPVRTCESCRLERSPLLLAPCPSGDGRDPLHRHVMCTICWPRQVWCSLVFGKLGAISWMN